MPLSDRLKGYAKRYKKRVKEGVCIPFEKGFKNGCCIQFLIDNRLMKIDINNSNIQFGTSEKSLYDLNLETYNNISSTEELTPESNKIISCAFYPMGWIAGSTLTVKMASITDPGKIIYYTIKLGKIATEEVKEQLENLLIRPTLNNPNSANYLSG